MEGEPYLVTGVFSHRAERRVWRSQPFVSGTRVQLARAVVHAQVGACVASLSLALAPRCLRWSFVVKGFGPRKRSCEGIWSPGAKTVRHRGELCLAQPGIKLCETSRSLPSLGNLTEEGEPYLSSEWFSFLGKPGALHGRPLAPGTQVGPSALKYKRGR